MIHYFFFITPVFRVSLYSKYRIERLVADGPAKTFWAVQSTSGRPVYLHVFVEEGKLLFDTVTSRFRDNAGRVIPPLIESGEFAGSLYLVTEVIEPFTNLQAWTASVAPGSIAAPAPAPESRPVAGASTKEPGEFTRMFALQQSGAPPVEVQPKEPGAFTREFMAVTPAKPVVEAPVIEPQGPSAWPKPAAEPSPQPPKPEAGKLPEKPVWPDPKPAAQKDFSDLFGPSIPGEHVDVEAEQAKAAQSAQPEDKPFRRAGEFTRMFGPGAQRKPVATPPPPVRPNTIASLFDSGIEAKPKPPVSSDPKNESKDESKNDPGPGEYTRMVAVPHQKEQPPVAPPPPPRPAAPASASNDRMLVIAFILIGVLTIAVIILGVLLYTKRV